MDSCPLGWNRFWLRFTMQFVYFCLLFTYVWQKPELVYIELFPIVFLLILDKYQEKKNFLIEFLVQSKYFISLVRQVQSSKFYKVFIRGGCTRVRRKAKFLSPYKKHRIDITQLVYTTALKIHWIYPKSNQQVLLGTQHTPSETIEICKIITVVSIPALRLGI